MVFEPMSLRDICLLKLPFEQKEDNECYFTHHHRIMGWQWFYEQIFYTVDVHTMREIYERLKSFLRRHYTNDERCGCVFTNQKDLRWIITYRNSEIDIYTNFEIIPMYFSSLVKESCEIRYNMTSTLDGHLSGFDFVIIEFSKYGDDFHYYIPHDFENIISKLICCFQRRRKRRFILTNVARRFLELGVRTIYKLVL